MTRISHTYGRRGRLHESDSGIRQVASTFGKPKFSTFNEKASGHINVEHNPERLISHLLAIDPRVKAFQPQPFSVDLVDQRLLLTKEAKSEAWHRHRDVEGEKLYTPDFSISWADGLFAAVEVKTEGFEGPEAYWDKIARARPILNANGYPLRTVIIPADANHPVRANAWQLKQAATKIETYLNDAIVEKVIEYCEDGPVTMSALCKDLQLHPGLIPVLLVAGVLNGDLGHCRIQGSFELSLAYGDLSHLCLLEVLEQ
jgi:hypothetical protein